VVLQKKVTQLSNSNQILIIAGEVSGDLFGAHLAKEMKQIANVSISAVGGDKLKQISNTFISHIAGKHVVGISSFLQRFSFMPKLKRQLMTHCLTNRPKVAIIIDFQHHHTAIAQLLQTMGIPIITYITPNYWVWKDVKKAQKIARYSQSIVCIFKPEYEFYKQFSSSVYYFGHPFMQLCTPKNKPKIRSQIAFFPGSRTQEFYRYTPLFLKAIQQVQQTRAFKPVFSLPHSQYKEDLTRLLSDYNLDETCIWKQDAAQLMSQSEGALMSSGSLTLEALLTRTPMAIIAILKPISYFFIKYIFRLKVPFIGLPNILANQEIVPELVQHDVTVQSLTHIINQLLDHKLSTENYKLALNQINGDAPIKHVAQHIINKCQSL